MIDHLRLRRDIAPASDHSLFSHVRSVTAVGDVAAVNPTTNRFLHDVDDSTHDWASAYRPGTVENSELLRCCAVTPSGYLQDAWAYLARSISSLVEGDPERAIHLAYYAELAAVQCLLGHSGLVLRNAKCFIRSCPEVGGNWTSGSVCILAPRPFRPRFGLSP